VSKIVVDTVESSGSTVTINDAVTSTGAISAGTNAITAGSITGLTAASITSGTLGAGAAVTNASLPDGHILQVVQTVFTGMFDSTASTWTAVTGMSASITPSSTDSKILVMIQSASSNSTSTANVSSVIYRGGTISAYLGDAAGSRIRAGAAVANPGAWAQGPFSLIYLDSPSTTSATTYQLYCKSPNATWRINGTGEDYDATNQWRSASSVTLMEIKA
jgi:hypothetical protein